MTGSLIRLTRPYYTLPLSSGLFVITAYITGGDIDVLDSKLAYGFISLFLVISGGYTLNDVFDLSVDAVNSPTRVLPKNTITPRAAFISAIILIIAGLDISLYCGFKFFGVLAMVSAGLVLYDMYSKRMGIFKNVTAAAITTSLYPLSFALAEPVQTSRLNALFIFPVWLFFTATGYEMLKDIEDIRGDCMRKDNRLYCSHPGFLLGARIILFCASALTLLPWLLGYCKSVYLFSSVAAILLVLISLRLPPRKAVPLIYSEVFIITAGSLVDLLVYGP